MNISNHYWKGKKRPEHSKKLTGRKRPDQSERMKKNNPMKNHGIARKSGETRKGKNHPFYGKKRPDISEINRKRVGKNHPLFGKNHTEKTRKLMRENHADFSGKNHPFYGKCHVEKTIKILREKNIGENHPNWQGGISKLPYAPEWTKKRKKEVFERDEYKCQNPDCRGKCKDDDIMPHHIDHDKMNCRIDNLITLCRSCNTRANYNKSYWQKLYEGIIISKEKEILIS